MSGGLEMERIRAGGGGGGVEQQQQQQGGEKEVLQKLISSTTTAAATNNNKGNLHGRGNGRNNHANRQQFNNNPPGRYNNSNNNNHNSKKQFRRHHRRQHQNAQRRMNNSNFHEHHGKRIRRNTQPAPNNTNEFLMQEHDHLYHLDFNYEDESGPGYIDFNPSHLYSNPEGIDASHDLDFINGPSTTISGGPANVGGAFYSSSEDDQDYLSREFSATYDTVNAERLSSMTKAELISEYQLLQDRVELLERKLKTGADVYGTTTITTTTTTMDGRINTSSTNPASSNEMVVELFPPPTDTITATTSTSHSSNLCDDDNDGGGGGSIQGAHEEILKLREENQKIKADNKYLRKMTLKQGDGGEVVGMEEDDDMEADRASTDSGNGGMSK